MLVLNYVYANNFVCTLPKYVIQMCYSFFATKRAAITTVNKAYVTKLLGLMSHFAQIILSYRFINGRQGHPSVRFGEYLFGRPKMA